MRREDELKEHARVKELIAERNTRIAELERLHVATKDNLRLLQVDFTAERQRAETAETALRWALDHDPSPTQLEAWCLEVMRRARSALAAPAGEGESLAERGREYRAAYERHARGDLPAPAAPEPAPAGEGPKDGDLILEAEPVDTETLALLTGKPAPVAPEPARCDGSGVARRTRTETVDKVGTHSVPCPGCPACAKPACETCGGSGTVGNPPSGPDENDTFENCPDCPKPEEPKCEACGGGPLNCKGQTKCWECIKDILDNGPNARPDAKPAPDVAALIAKLGTYMGVVNVQPEKLTEILTAAQKHERDEARAEGRLAGLAEAERVVENRCSMARHIQEPHGVRREALRIRDDIRALRERKANDE